VTTAVPPILRPRKAGTWYVVRDAKGELRHTGRTRGDALAPYTGAVTRREVKGRTRAVPDDVVSIRKSRLWLFLYRHGWRCALETRPPATPHAPTTAPE
jgi:hypothetical protein